MKTKDFKMKRFAILTSVLALAACGGSGSGGMSEFDRAALSNANVTGMVSRIQDGDTYSNFARTATVGRASSSRDTSSNIFLDDVLFESADKEYDTVKFLGTDVYYKIYKSSARLNSEADDLITIANKSDSASAAAERMIQSYKFQP